MLISRYYNKSYLINIQIIQLYKLYNLNVNWNYFYWFGDSRIIILKISLFKTSLIFDLECNIIVAFSNLH